MESGDGFARFSGTAPAREVVRRKPSALLLKRANADCGHLGRCPWHRSRWSPKLNKTSITECLIGDDGTRTLTRGVRIGSAYTDSDPLQFQHPQSASA